MKIVNMVSASILAISIATFAIGMARAPKVDTIKVSKSKGDKGCTQVPCLIENMCFEAEEVAGGPFTGERYAPRYGGGCCIFNKYRKYWCPDLNAYMCRPEDKKGETTAACPPAPPC